MEYLLALDQKILYWLNSLVENWGFVNIVFAKWLIYLIPIILLWLWFFSEKSKKAAIRAFLAIMLAWPVIALIIGKIINRPRPFELDKAKELLFHPPTYSFPSDHAVALFTLFFSLYLSGYKKLSFWILALAIIVSVFRVATGLHFPTDIIAGAALGIFCSWLVKTFDKQLNPLYDFIIRLARKLRLA